jgi:hypothetical protein
MGIGSYKSIGIGDSFAVFFPQMYNICQVFKVYLVDYATSRRYYVEVVKSILSPM